MHGVEGYQVWKFRELAQDIMWERDEELVDDFANIICFLEDNPGLAPSFRGKRAPEFGSTEYVVRLADRYISGLEPSPLISPGTVPDPALAVVMIHGYGFDSSDIDDLVEGHRWAMVAENVVGELLERYIYSKLDARDWIWCAGEVVRSVDFIRVSDDPDERWESLQIKNRDNSENSSSSAVRKGTSIAKWFRTVSRTGETRWSNFPVRADGSALSERDFQEYIIEYMEGLPPSYRPTL